MGGRDFRPSEKVDEVVDALRETLRTLPILFDVDECIRHVRLNGRWYSEKGDVEAPPGSCEIRTQINGRWSLVICKHPFLHPDTQAITGWAARLLGDLLPWRTSDDEAVPPFGGSGGSSGSAEIGIPLWWARKARS